MQYQLPALNIESIIEQASGSSRRSTKDHLLPPYLIYGLDIGSATCGLSIVDVANNEIVYAGTHLWTQSIDYTGRSLATIHRERKGLRKKRRRRRSRKKACFELLQEIKLIPVGETAATYLASRKGDKDVIQLRAEGLYRMLEDRELARIIYNLVSYRGYVPRPGTCSTAQDDVDETQQMLSAISENDRKISEGGYRTAGEMIYYTSGGRSRNHGEYSLCLSAKQVQNEMKCLLETQTALGKHLPEDIYECLLEISYPHQSTIQAEQRAEQQISRCCYFADEKRAAKCLPSVEMCHVNEQLGNVMLIDKSSPEGRHLTPKQRDAIKSVLFSCAMPNYLDFIERCHTDVKLSKNEKKKIKNRIDKIAKRGTILWEELRILLCLDDSVRFKGVPRDCEKESSSSAAQAPAWAMLREHLPLDLLEKMKSNIEWADAIVDCLAKSQSAESLARRLDEIEIEDVDKRKVESLPFADGVFRRGCARKSAKAACMLNGMFEDDEIVTLCDAEDAAGMRQYRPTIEKTCTLPPFTMFAPHERNHNLIHTMSCVRKFMNAAIRQFGLPDEVHVELARSMGQSKWERIKDHKAIQARTAKLDSLRRECANVLECSVDSVPKNTVARLELFNQQNGMDVYDGEMLDRTLVITDENYANIDHILPITRSYDDSLSNKVLTKRTCNKDKLNDIPYEWFSRNAENVKAFESAWDRFVHRVEEIYGTAQHMKQKKLLAKELVVDTSFGRNLCDTRSAGKSAVRYIEECLLMSEHDERDWKTWEEHGVPVHRKQKVFSVKGQATALLRKYWCIEKDEEDPRNHALDAIIIALCSPSIMAKLTAKARNGRLDVLGADVIPPLWDGMQKDIMTYMEHVLPTYAIHKKRTGKMYEDTLYSAPNPPNDKGFLELFLKGKSLGMCSNWHMTGEKTAQKVGDVRRVFLWWSDTDKWQNRTGRFYIEPEYFADEAETNVENKKHYFCKKRIARRCWEEIPQTVTDAGPYCILHRDTALIVKGQLYFYKSINISGASLIVKDIYGRTQNIALSDKTPDTLYPVFWNVLGPQVLC